VVSDALFDLLIEAPESAISGELEAETLLLLNLASGKIQPPVATSPHPLWVDLDAKPAVRARQSHPSTGVYVWR
jgi:hypothetical protein